MIELRNVSKFFDQTPAVEELTLSIPKGKFCASGRHFWLRKINHFANDQSSADPQQRRD